MNRESLPRFPTNLKPSVTSGARICNIGDRENTWRLEIPSGPPNRYRLAQLDDYRSLPRSGFPWSPPLRLSLYARSSSKFISGTWGFGLWNDPFSMGMLSRASGMRLPVFPNAAWFFFASPSSHLALRDDIPAQGWLASTYRSPHWSRVLTPLWAAVLPVLLLPPGVRLIRHMISRTLKQDAIALSFDPTEWRSYELIWMAEYVEFWVNGDLALRTSVVPVGPLGCVIWVDNQYAAVHPSGRLHYGFLSNPEPAWIEFSQLSIVQI